MITIYILQWPHFWPPWAATLTTVPPPPLFLSSQSDPFKTELNYITPVFNLPEAPHFIQVTPQALQGPHYLYNPSPSLKFCFLCGYSLSQGCCMAQLSKSPFRWFSGLFVLLNTDLSKAYTDLPIYDATSLTYSSLWSPFLALFVFNCSSRIILYHLFNIYLLFSFVYPH